MRLNVFPKLAYPLTTFKNPEIYLFTAILWQLGIA